MWLAGFGRFCLASLGFGLASVGFGIIGLDLVLVFGLVFILVLVGFDWFRFGLVLIRFG
jgi:hypothetical protein